MLAAGFSQHLFQCRRCRNHITQQQKEGLAHIPKDRFLLESDAPYVAPQMAAKRVPKRRLVCHPYTLVQVAWVVAEVHQTAVSIVLNQTARNARRFLRFGGSGSLGTDRGKS